MTRYFRFSGTLMVDGEAVTDARQHTELVTHMLHALDAYDDDGFRFVDVDASGILTTGQVSIEWTDYDLPVTNTGRIMKDSEIEALADEAERGYCVVPLLNEDRICGRGLPCPVHPS